MPLTTTMSVLTQPSSRRDLPGPSDHDTYAEICQAGTVLPNSLSSQHASFYFLLSMVPRLCIFLPAAVPALTRCLPLELDYRIGRL